MSEAGKDPVGVALADSRRLLEEMDVLLERVRALMRERDLDMVIVTPGEGGIVEK